LEQILNSLGGAEQDLKAEGRGLIAGSEGEGPSPLAQIVTSRIVVG
jgi:hypothetical protein